MSKAVENRESIIIFKLTGVQILPKTLKSVNIATNAVFVFKKLTLKST